MNEENITKKVLMMIEVICFYHYAENVKTSAFAEFRKTQAFHNEAVLMIR